jgi:hypothetical protein
MKVHSQSNGNARDIPRKVKVKTKVKLNFERVELAQPDGGLNI